MADIKQNVHGQCEFSGLTILYVFHTRFIDIISFGNWRRMNFGALGTPEQIMKDFASTIHPLCLVSQMDKVSQDLSLICGRFSAIGSDEDVT